MFDFQNKALACLASLALCGQLNAHPLDFLTPEQRVFMMNKILDSQSELSPSSGRAKAADGSGAAPLTQEQRARLINWFMTGQGADDARAASRQSLAAANPSPGPVQALPTAQPNAAAAPQENELATLFSRWGSLSRGVSFTRLRDGFSIDGARYLDPEGRITAYGFDAQSGDFTWLAQRGDGGFVVKTGRAGVQADPVEIGTAVWQNGVWTVVTATGRKLSGKRLIPLARGFIVARDNTGYRYVPGKGLTPFAAPEQFSIAALQSGNVSGTGYILLERNPDEQPAANSLGGLFNSVKALGNTLGIGKKEDYALLNIDSKKLVPINISMEDKRVQVLSVCRRQSRYISECERMDSYDSLFQANGMHNMTHYFWRINWFSAQGRAVMVSQEGGLTKVAATDLDTGRKLVLFERAMGIASFDANQSVDGKISVTAQLGFSSEKKENVVELLDASGVIEKEAD